MLHLIMGILFLTACVNCGTDQRYVDIPFEKARLISLQNSPEVVEISGSRNYTVDGYTSEEDEPENLTEDISEYADGDESNESDSEEIGEVDSKFHTHLQKRIPFENGTAKILPPCPEEKIIQLMKLLHTINPEGVVLRAMERDIIIFCRKLQIGLYKMNRFTTDCDPSKDGILYQQLTKGTHTLSEKVCRDDAFQDEFSQHAKCYNRLREEYKDCFGPSGWSESSNSDYVCASYRNIINCFFVKTVHLCGKEAASINIKLLTLVVDSMITVKCKSTDQRADVVKSAGVIFYGSISSFPCIIVHFTSNKIVLGVN
ncbi:hypothetical protein J437_LFUL009399 [Ladona fulva]|uniref:Uncharacterized protein n=1 Tax=Ladona fulva TaxID=123851 RepID=A0A8K0K6M3_LADFU|nr:hypothetical protein J437_LFUL009399 [Ladona fulva]